MSPYRTASLTQLSFLRARDPRRPPCPRKSLPRISSTKHAETKMPTAYVTSSQVVLCCTITDKLQRLLGYGRKRVNVGITLFYLQACIIFLCLGLSSFRLARLQYTLSILIRFRGSFSCKNVGCPSRSLFRRGCLSSVTVQSKRWNSTKYNIYKSF